MKVEHDGGALVRIEMTVAQARRVLWDMQDDYPWRVDSQLAQLRDALSLAGITPCRTTGEGS